MYPAIAVRAHSCVCVTRSLLWDKSCQLENYTFWKSAKNVTRTRGGGAGGVAKANISLALAQHGSQLHNCCLYFGLSACKIRNSNANVQRN